MTGGWVTGRQVTGRQVTGGRVTGGRVTGGQVTGRWVAERHTLMTLRMTKIFFSFYFTRDYYRAYQVMQSWLKQPNANATPFISSQEIERMGRDGLTAIYQWIEAEVQSSDITVVLIGQETAGRHFVEYEIAQAQKIQQPIFGVHIHQIKDAEGNGDRSGQNPLLPIFKTYDWIEDDGTQHLRHWVDEAIATVDTQYAQLAPLYKALVDRTAALRHQVLSPPD